MSLLSDLFAGRLLDPGYAEAAARRAAAGDAAPRRSRFGGGGVLLVLVLVGVLVFVAGAEVRRSEPVAAAQRSRLVDEIHARTGETDDLQRRLDRLRAETERERAAALARSADGRHARESLAEASAAAAAAPVTGAGFVVTLDDASGADGDDRHDQDPADGRIYDQDLQILVNGLWAAGATAIAVNGQRLTATTAIRTAGEAILVDYRPLSGPYEVTAAGDPDRVRGAYRDSAADRRLRLLKERYRIRYDTRRDDRVSLPAAAALQLRYAHPQGEETGAAGGGHRESGQGAGSRGNGRGGHE